MTNAHDCALTYCQNHAILLAATVGYHISNINAFSSMIDFTEIQ